MTKLILIRHAHTPSNSAAEARLCGRTDVPLSARGHEELRALRERLRWAAPFDAIYSSPLQRAHHTALALAEEGLGPLRVCDGLQEIDCGALDGLPLDQVKRRFPHHWEANLRQDDERFRWPGGESYREFRYRCLRAVRALVRAHPGGRIALVTHAGVVSQILGAIRGLSPARWECHRPMNTALTEVDWSRDSAAVVAFDDHAHLSPFRLRRWSPAQHQ